VEAGPIKALRVAPLGMDRSMRDHLGALNVAAMANIIHQLRNGVVLPVSEIHRQFFRPQHSGVPLVHLDADRTGLWSCAPGVLSGFPACAVIMSSDAKAYKRPASRPIQ